MATDIEIVRGTSNTFEISITDSNDEQYNMTEGEVLVFGVKRKGNQEEVVILKKATESVDGVCTIEIDPSDTANLETGRYVYDVGLQSGGDYFNIIGQSQFNIQPNVTSWGDGQE